ASGNEYGGIMSHKIQAGTAHNQGPAQGSDTLTQPEVDQLKLKLKTNIRGADGDLAKALNSIYKNIDDDPKSGPPWKARMTRDSVERHIGDALQGMDAKTGAEARQRVTGIIENILDDRGPTR